jgi:hypothetical protein
MPTSSAVRVGAAFTTVGIVVAATAVAATAVAGAASRALRVLLLVGFFI